MNIYDLFGAGECFAGVRVPAIQREYVQGRRDASGEKARSEFLPLLVDASKRSGKKNLHFIYGIKNQQDGFFLPLDGQQRITTLFLLAWCNGEVSSNWKFEYESRRVATEFLRELAAHPRMNADMSIDDWVSTSDWFVPVWKQDETVSGMLAMLRAIDALDGDRSVKKGSLDLHRITFEIKRLDVNDVFYGQIFLKMNARGKPLTPWENLKAILDANMDQAVEKSCGFATLNEAGKMYKSSWKREVDGEWCDGLWEISEKKIEKLNAVYDRVARVAFACVAGREVNAPCYEISKWLKECGKEDKFTFYDSISAGLSIVSTRHELLRSYWSACRRDNGLWGGSGSDDTFLNWALKPIVATEDYDDVLRFFFLTCMIKHNKEQRRMRVLLNLLDATRVSRNPTEKSGGYYLMARSGRNFLLGSIEIDALEGFNTIQLEDEKAKWSRCDEASLIVIEKGALVFQGSTKFVPADLYNDAKQLACCIEKIKNYIERNELSFYCALLAHLPASDEHHYVGSVYIPHNDKLESWGSEILSDEDCARAVADVLMGRDSGKCPLWVQHFKELSEMHNGPLLGLRKLRNYGEWMYAVKATNRTDDAVRFDRSDSDRKNRLEFFSGRQYFKYGPSLRQGLGDKYVDKYYNVDSEEWITKKNPTAYDKDGNPLEVNQ